MHASPEIVRSFRRSLRLLERQVELSLASQTECCGVTPAQCHLLLEVAASEGSSVAELAEALELDASTLSRAVDGLVRAGYLERTEDSNNRRRYLVSLSKAGRKKVSEIDRNCDAYYEGLLGSLAARERAQVMEFLPRFASALQAWRRATENPSCCASEKGAGREVR